MHFHTVLLSGPVFYEKERSGGKGLSEENMTGRALFFYRHLYFSIPADPDISEPEKHVLH